MGRLRTHEHILVDEKSCKPIPWIRLDARSGDLLEGLFDLKQVILKDAQKFRRCLVEKLLTYALDREVNFTDEPLIQELVEGMSTHDDRMHSLIHARG